MARDCDAVQNGECWFKEATSTILANLSELREFHYFGLLAKNLQFQWKLVSFIFELGSARNLWLVIY